MFTEDGFCRKYNQPSVSSHNHSQNVLINELRSDEALDPRNVTTLKSLKQAFGVVEKNKDDFKSSLDEPFAKMCFKKRRALSCGEIKRELKS
jgi:hypothetical protein